MVIPVPSSASDAGSGAGAIGSFGGRVPVNSWLWTSPVRPIAAAMKVPAMCAFPDRIANGASTKAVSWPSMVTEVASEKLNRMFVFRLLSPEFC